MEGLQAYVLVRKRKGCQADNVSESTHHSQQMDSLQQEEITCILEGVTESDHV